jgi:hypothetical protein
MAVSSGSIVLALNKYATISKGMTWVERVDHMWVTRNPYKIVVDKSEGKIPL